MTANARKMISSRPGKGRSQASVSIGSASAAARVTAPRIPIQPIAAGLSRGPTTKTQPRRTTITAAATSAASRIKFPRGLVVERVENRIQLQPDQREEQCVDDEDERLEDRPRLDPHGRRRQLGSAPAQVDADRDGGKDTGDSERLGGERRGSRRAAIRISAGMLSSRIRTSATTHPARPTAIPPTTLTAKSKPALQIEKLPETAVTAAP